jgi:hypothetical protein
LGMDLTIGEVNNGSYTISMLLANPSQWSHCRRHREKTEADLMEEQSSSFFTLQFMLNGMGLLDRLSKMKGCVARNLMKNPRAKLFLFCRVQAATPNNLAMNAA